MTSCDTRDLKDFKVAVNVAVNVAWERRAMSPTRTPSGDRGTSRNCSAMRAKVAHVARHLHFSIAQLHLNHGIDF